MKAFFRSVFIAFYSFLWCSIVLAQEHPISICGRIVDESLQPIPGATITQLNSNTGVVSEKDGHFCIDIDLTVSKDIILEVRYLGYEAVQKTIRSKEYQKELLIQLKSSQKELDEIQVFAKGQSFDLERKGYSNSSIEAKKMAVMSIEVNQILRQNAGVQIRQEGGLGSRARYSIHGLGDKAIRFFWDGIPMEYFGSSFSVNTIPVSLIHRIDVYKGVVPVQLGSDALGGAINIVEKKQLKNGGQLAYSLGSFNTHRFALSAYARSKKTGLSASVIAFYNYSDNDYTVWGKDISYTDSNYNVIRGLKVKRFHDGFESKAIKANITYSKLKWAEDLHVGVIQSDLDKEIQHGATMLVPFGKATYSQDMFMPYLKIDNISFADKKIKLNTFTAVSKLKRARVDTSVFIYNWLGEIEAQQRVQGGEQRYTLNTLKELNFINRLNFQHQLTDHHTVSVNSVFSTIERTDRDPLITQKTDGYFSPQYYKKHIFGIALESQFLDNRLKTNLFAKHNWFEADIKTVEISGGIKQYPHQTTQSSKVGLGFASSYELNRQLLVSLSVEWANRLPEINEILGDGLNIIANPEIEAEQSTNFNLDLKWRLLDTPEHQLRLNTTTFFRLVDHKINRVTSDSDPSLLQYQNFDKVDVSGLDASIFYSKNDLLSLSYSYSLLHPVIKTDTDALGNKNGLANSRLPNTPFYQSHGAFRYQLPPFLGKSSQLNFHWHFSYIASFYRSSEKYGNRNKDSIPTQHTHSAGLSYKNGKRPVTISLDIRNIFDAQAFDNYAVQKPGRSFFTKITYTF